MNVVAVIPVFGRLPLLEVTIRRLYRKNKVDKVICVGHLEEDRALCKKMGVAWVQHENNPLGRKWNAGFIKAKDYNPDAVLYVGSSDWVSDNWLPVMLPFLEKFDMVGKPDFNMLHYGKVRIMFHWTGYPAGSWREYEPIGIGRLLSSRFLDSIDWQPFYDEANNGMDFCQVMKLTKAKGKLFIFNSMETQSLSLSCDQWGAMHKENLRADLPNVHEIYKPDMFLKTWFPEAFEL
jgi:hypothetical protein